MIASDFKDIDGFKLQFEESCPDEERSFYMRTFLRVDDVAKDRVHCTTCDVHVGTAPISEKIIRTHQILGVTQCNKCFAFYNSGEFGKGEDGSEYYCRWCGQGGEVFCCSTCPFVFCNKCIRDNLTTAYIKEIERNDDWSCFVCNRETLKRLRAQHWALRNFMNKQLEKIQNVNINSEEELNTMLNDDKSVCCPRKKRKQILKPAPAAPVKRPAMNGGGLTLAGPPAKKQIIAPTKMLKVPVNTNYHQTKPGPKPTPPASFSKPRSNDEVVCTPDIMGLFNNKAQSAQQRPIATAPPPLIMRQNQRPIRPMASTSTAPNPIYHTVNGFQIDLNQAARQEIFRLPNGKLIQVRKQPNSTPPAPTLRPGLHLAMQARAQIPIRPAPPTITTTSRMLRPSMAPTLRVARPQMQQNRPPAPTPSTSQIASTVFTQQNGSISVARAPQPDTPFGKAKTAFEDKIINGLEICQHTINKMITLTNSSSFKTSRSFSDLKELYIHLQYLFTYTSGKIKTLQDSLATNVEELAKHDKNLKEKEKHDEDELEIVEQKQDVIEVLSDDDDDDASNATPVKKVLEDVVKNTPVEKPPEEQNVDLEQEIMSAIVATMQNTFARQPDPVELLASCNYASEDKKLLTKSVVKVERLEDSKSPLVKQFMIAIQQRRDREPSVEANDENDIEMDGDDDFPPLIPEVVMDENPSQEENNDTVETESNKDKTETETQDEDTSKSINNSAEVVEIPSDDDEAASIKTTQSENEIGKELETKADETSSNNDEDASKGDAEKNEDQSTEVAESAMETNEAEQESNNESKEQEVEQKSEYEIPEEMADISQEPSIETMEINDSVDEITNEILNGDAEEDTTLACAEQLEQNQPEAITENGTSDIIQEENQDTAVITIVDSNEEITKITENGIDEKDLLDTLINSLDENEPLAPIELENFP